jgi:hypothetical protein
VCYTPHVSPDEKSEMQTALRTLGDPKGNWLFAWNVLCRIAGIESERLSPPFVEHPVVPSASNNQGGPDNVLTLPLQGRGSKQGDGIA